MVNEKKPRNGIAGCPPGHPQVGDDAGAVTRHDGRDMQPRTYEITFTGQAGAALRAEFDDCEVTVGSGTTTLRAEVPDQAALLGLVERINALRLDMIDMHLVRPPSTS